MNLVPVPTAAKVPFTPAGTVAATNVQSAIQEVAGEAGQGSGASATFSVTDVGTGSNAIATFTNGVLTSYELNP